MMLNCSVLPKPWSSNNAYSSEKEKVEGEELQKWLRLVVAPTELAIFINGKQESVLPLQTLQTGS